MTGERGSLFDARYRLVTIPVLTLVAVSAFDAIAVVAALPAVGADLGRVDGLSWVLTAYLLTATISILVAGQVIDVIGPRASFRTTVALYTTASIGCTLAPTFETLVAFRVLQGIGGGFVLAVTLSVIGLAFPPLLRPRMFAGNAVVYGVGALAGPALAAALVTSVGWRGVFACSAVLGLQAGVVGWSRLPDPPRTARLRMPFEPGSMLLLGLAIVILVVGLSRLSLRSLVAVAVAVLLGLAYWRRASRTARPVLELRFVGSMPYAAVTLGAASCFGAALGLNSYLPVYVQAGLGRSPETAAFSALFLSIGWTLASITVSRIVYRFRRETLAVVGNGLVAGCLLAGLVVTGPSAPLSLVLALFFGAGCGVGIVSLCLITLLQAHAPSHEIGRATAAYQFSRQLGYTCGAGLTGALVVFVVGALIGDMEPVRQLLAGEVTAVDGRAREAVATGFRLAHLGALAFVVVGLGASLRLRAFTTSRP